MAWTLAALMARRREHSCPGAMALADAWQHRRLCHGGCLRKPDHGISELLAGKGYDSNSFREFLKDRGIKPLSLASRIVRRKSATTSRPIRIANAVERCFCRLKDLRRIATRYDKLARNFFSAVCFVTTLAFWLRSD
jgi:transposase